MTTTFIIDNKGDTLLILRYPNRPFKKADQDDLWDNHLELHDDDTNIYKSHLLDKKGEFRDTGVSYPASKNPRKDVSWRVSSQKLKNASVYFRDLAAEDWKESNISEQGYKYTITVEGWSSRVLHKLILAMHGEHFHLDGVKSEPKLGAQLAVIIDAYQCHNLVRLRFPPVPGRYPYNENLLFSFFSSWVFGDEECFEIFSKSIIIQTRGRMHTLGMPVPESIIDAIDQRRQYYIDEMLNDVHDTALTSNQKVREHLVNSLSGVFRSWPLEEPFEGLSVLNVYRALKDIRKLHNIRLNDFYNQTDSFSDMDTSMSARRRHLPILGSLRGSWDGLDMSAFSTHI
ncbi:hypothetical protein GGI43DRAFT_432880 [Trichoderma evansii]